jgi:hypothetical protein
VHPVAGGGPLPAYVRRPHDERLRLIVAPPVEASRLVVVRGEPGTGTTRAAWEASPGSWPSGRWSTRGPLRHWPRG